MASTPTRLTRLPSTPRSPETMTPRQLDRRKAAVDAVIGLVAERGVDDLQMREVAERSGVALGTLYRYFSSKDHLVAEAFMSWAGSLQGHVARRQVLETTGEATMAERLMAVLKVGIRPFQRQPQFARVLLYVSVSADPFASECYLRLGTIIRQTLAPAIADLSPDDRQGVLQAIGSIWYHSLIEWVSGRITIVGVYERLEQACHLLLDHRPVPRS